MRVGNALAEGILAVGHPRVAGVRGRGLWRAIVLAEPIGVAFGEAAVRAGFLVSPVRPTAIRLAPPLVLGTAEVEEFTGALPEILAQAAAP